MDRRWWTYRKVIRPLKEHIWSKQIEGSGKKRIIEYPSTLLRLIHEGHQKRTVDVKLRGGGNARADIKKTAVDL